MALLEKEAIRFAKSLDDYEHVSVTDLGGSQSHNYWLVVRDHRFDIEYQIGSHCTTGTSSRLLWPTAAVFL